MLPPYKPTQIFAAIAGLLACAALATRSDAHGIPIVVNIVNDAIAVSGGTADPDGFAPQMFISADEDGALSHVTLPIFGPVALTTLPGLYLSDIEVDGGLFLNIVRRPVNSIESYQERMLWFATASGVATPANGDSLVIADEFGQITVPRSGPTPAPLKIANPNVDEINEHIHPLRYLLDNSPSAAIGAYGFFAILTSNMAVAPSEPLLIILNNGIDDPEELLIAAKRINAAAFLPGDYNHDDRVDAADYIVWRRTLNATGFAAADGSGNGVVDLADYDVWRANFGLAFPAALASGISTAATVPEPTSAAIGVVGVVVVIVARRRRRTPSRNGSAI